MKKIKSFIALLMLSFIFAACGISSAGVSTTKNVSSSLTDIQNAVRETQTAFENKNSAETQKGISKLIKLSEDSFYSESERLIARYCATYINGGIMLDYIIRNDKKWVETHDVATFDIFYGGIFKEVVNGNVTHIDTLKEYVGGLVNATSEIYFHYNELTGK